MRARSLLVAAAVVFAAVPAGAQEHMWTADRPDGVTPIGIMGGSTLASGEVELTLMHQKSDLQGIRFDSQLLDPLSLFGFFTQVPLELTTEAYSVRVAFGVSDNLTFTGGASFLLKDRLALTETDEFFQVDTEGISDIDVELLYNVYESGGNRGHVQLGLIIPVGSVSQDANAPGFRTGTAPYDMQIGGGGLGIRPGGTVKMQNEVGTIGAQLQGTIYVVERGDWKPGNSVTANAWVSYNLNRYFSLSAGASAVGLGAIEGEDPTLDPFRDPGEVALSYGGERVNLPVGLNLYMPDGRWEGHRLSIELDFTVHEQLDGPWLARDSGFSVAWQKVF